MRLLLILLSLSLSLVVVRMCVNFFSFLYSWSSLGSLGRPSPRVWPSFSSYSWSFRVRVVAGSLAGLSLSLSLGRRSPKGREQQEEAPGGDKQKYDPT